MTFRVRLWNQWRQTSTMRRRRTQRMWQAYYASVTFMDEQLGRVLDELDSQGLTDSTAIVFTTDHGYHLGEHGFWQKGNLHEEVTRVPFMIRTPGLKPGRTNSMAELVDFYPTCLDLLGLPAPKEIVGKSLVPILKNPILRSETPPFRCTTKDM